MPFVRTELARLGVLSRTSVAVQLCFSAAGRRGRRHATHDRRRGRGRRQRRRRRGGVEGPRRQSGRGDRRGPPCAARADGGQAHRPSRRPGGRAARRARRPFSTRWSRNWAGTASSARRDPQVYPPPRPAAAPPGRRLAQPHWRPSRSTRPRARSSPPTGRPAAPRVPLETGEAVEIGEDAALSAEGYFRAVEAIRGHLCTKGSATVSDLKPVLGVSRRIMVPLLERLDRDGVTMCRETCACCEARDRQDAKDADSSPCRPPAGRVHAAHARCRRSECARTSLRPCALTLAPMQRRESTARP